MYLEHLLSAFANMYFLEKEQKNHKAIYISKITSVKILSCKRHKFCQTI